MRKAMNHASAKGVTGVSRGEKSQSCSAAWSGCHESICQIEGKQGRLNDEILIFFDEWGPTCFDSIKASAISSSRLSSSFIWGTSCWMVTLWGDGRCKTVKTFSSSCYRHWATHRLTMQLATMPVTPLGRRRESVIKTCTFHHAPVQLCWGKSNPLSRAWINWACLTAGCPVEVMLGHVS